MRAIPGVTLTAATLLAFVGQAAAVAASDSTDPRLSATLVGSLEAGAEGRLAVRWDGPPGALLDLWVDLDGDGSPSSPELVAEGRPLTPGIEVVSFELPPGVPVVPEPTVWVRARAGGWCDTKATVAAAAAGDNGDVCGWQPGFEYWRLEGSAGAMTVWDDGSGPALYVGGDFTTISGMTVNHIARWDGNTWSALGTGMEGPYASWVSALAVFDDETGPALYAGGSFETAGGVTVNNIARWDGTAWSALGGPTGIGVNGWLVRALTVFDDGSGPALYVGGQFATAGGVTVNNIARWDGSEWSALSGPSGTGVSWDVHALAVYDDGSGPALYAGGSFGYAGGEWVLHVARWDGSAWSPLSGPAGTGTSGTVWDLAVYDDGSGPALYVGGEFDTAGGVTVNDVARWDGTSWSALSGPSGTGVNGSPWVRALAVFDDGSGPALYVGGGFDTAGGVTVNHIARWDGSAWSALSGPSGTGMDFFVSGLAVYDDGSGPVLVAGGGFTTAGGMPVDHIARWDGDAWSALTSSSAAGVSGPVSALTVFDDGTGPALYAGGWFGAAGGLTVGSIAQWDGSAWSPLVGPTGMGVDGRVNALAVFDDGSGPALYAGGSFPSIGSLAVNNIARWDGSSWAALGWYGSEGLSGEVLGLAVYDDGTGPALYVGGGFLTAGWSTTVNGIARWDGSGWSALAGPAGTGMDGEVHALAVFDDGTGPTLYVGGSFETAGGVTVNSVARWDGTAWSDLSGGVSFPGGNPTGWVEALAVFDDGPGPALFVGGVFEYAGPVLARSIARWDGVGWSDLAGGVYGFFSWSIDSLAVYDDGTRPALYAGGTFSGAGSVEALNIARWDGSEWSSLGTGVGYFDTTAVLALSPFDDGSGETLYVGGNFTTAGGLPSGNIAAWRCFPNIFADGFENGSTAAWSHTVP